MERREQIDQIKAILGIAKEDYQAGMQESEETYLESIRQFLLGQDFMRLGRCIQGKQWNLVLSNSNRLKKHCKELGISCFDRYLDGIRNAARRQNGEEALQLMSQITVRRVQLRNLFTEEKRACDM